MSPRDHKSIADAQSPQLPLADGSCDPVDGKGEIPTGAPAGHGGQDIAAPCGSTAPPHQPEKSGGLKLHGGAVISFSASAPVGGGSFDDVYRQRLEHLARGYTPEHDAQVPDCFLENRAQSYLHTAKLDRQKGDGLEGLLRARRKYVAAAALIHAQIDRIDFIQSKQGDDDNDG